jgi:hypothetical protein
VKDLQKNFEPNTNFKILLRLQQEQKNEGANRVGYITKEQILQLFILKWDTQFLTQK